MSSSEGKNHSSKCILSLPGTKELSRIRPPPSDSKEKDLFFRLVQRPYQAGDLDVLALPPILASVSLDLAGPSSMISMMTRADALCLQGVYRILDDVRVLVPSLDDSVTSREPGKIALYEDFFLAGFYLPLHPFIRSFLNNYNLVSTQSIPNFCRIVCSFIRLCHFHGIVAWFSLFRTIFILKCHPTKRGWWFVAP